MSGPKNRSPSNAGTRSRTNERTAYAFNKTENRITLNLEVHGNINHTIFTHLKWRSCFHWPEVLQRLARCQNFDRNDLTDIA